MGTLGKRKMNTLGDIAVAILMVTSGNIMRIENVVRGHIG